MDILVIGQAPGRKPGGALMGRAGEKLADLHGVPHAEFMATRDVINLLDYFPGKAGKGDAFPMAEAREQAARYDLSRWDRVVFLGRNVACAFGLRAPFLAWHLLDGSLCAAVPHTSGVNTWWNDPRNEAAARRFCLALEAERQSSPTRTNFIP